MAEGGRGGRPSGSGPRQVEARAIAETVGNEIAVKLNAKLVEMTDSLHAKFSGLASGAALERRIEECSIRLKNLEQMLARQNPANHDIATLTSRTGDMHQLLEELRQFYGQQQQVVDIVRHFCSEKLAELAQHINAIGSLTADKVSTVVQGVFLQALAGTARESTVTQNLASLESNNNQRHAELVARLNVLAPTPTKPDNATLQQRAAERALADKFEIREYSQMRTHPNIFVTERYRTGSTVIVEVMADGAYQIRVSGWKADYTAERGWAPSVFAEVAERAVVVVEGFRRKRRKQT